MYTYRVWIRINQTQTVHVNVTADSDWDAKMIAEAQYGQGSVLGYTKV